MFFQECFSVHDGEKTLEENAEQNLDYWAKCSTLYFALQNSVLCEAVNPLIKPSAEEILHTLLNDYKNKIQEENHHFIFSVSYGEIP